MTRDNSGRASQLLAQVSIWLFGFFVTAAVAISIWGHPPAQRISAVQITLMPLDFVPFIPRATSIAEDTTAPEAVGDLLAGHRCLSEAMYYEARGEGEKGERAVAEVVFARLAEGRHGNTICKVVYEGVGKTFCQFTFACDGSMTRPKNSHAWQAAQILAARLMVRELAPIPNIEGATNYHAARAHPPWASKLDVIAKIGNHIFYRAKPITTNSPGT